MEAKRPRLLSEPDWDVDDNNHFVTDFLKKSTEGEIREIYLCVKNSLAAKSVEITNSKLAFSAVARENKQLSNIKSELLSQIKNSHRVIDDQEKLINQKEKQIDDDKKDIDELECKMVNCEEDYESKLKTFLEENNDLKSDLKILSKEFRKKEKEISEMKAENEELTYDKNKLVDQRPYQNLSLSLKDEIFKSAFTIKGGHLV